MKKRTINIAIIGPIGVGKTTFGRRLFEKIKLANYNSYFFDEPSVEDAAINNSLNNFYKNNKLWAYPLQLQIAAKQDAIMTELKSLETINHIDPGYDFAVMDMPFSSYIYCNMHVMNKMMSKKDCKRILKSMRKFHFDYVISLDAEEETILKRVIDRDIAAQNEEGTAAPLDLPISNLKYVKRQVDFFNRKRKKFIKKYFRNAKVLQFICTDSDHPLYNIRMDEIAAEIMNERSLRYMEYVKRRYK